MKQTVNIHSTTGPNSNHDTAASVPPAFSTKLGQALLCGELRYTPPPHRLIFGLTLSHLVLTGTLSSHFFPATLLTSGR